MNLRFETQVPSLKFFSHEFKICESQKKRFCNSHLIIDLYGSQRLATQSAMELPTLADRDRVATLLVCLLSHWPQPPLRSIS